ncbi:major facilitator superfamily domain-containing protein [Boletus coccyginus]|nr:major facilitator superfamily domain-containing protein [Boletus coccyginus]
MSTPKLHDTSELEAAPPTSPGVTKSCCNLDEVSVLEDRLEGRSCSDVVDEGQITPSWVKALLGKRTNSRRDIDAIATRRSVFDDPHLAPFYWPTRDYENIHRFDPSARWSHREEKALLRKIDWNIMFIAAANQSMVLGLDFDLGNTVFRLSSLCAGLPSQLISKRIGPDRWVPIQICLWSIVSFSQSWLTGRASFLVCRVLLGFTPGLVLYMTYFYTEIELPIRLAAFSMSVNFCNIVAGFLDYGISHLNGVAGRAGWRWQFLIESLMTLAIGVASFFNMPPSPTQTKTWFRQKGWFTEREEVIIVNKVLRDDPTKGDMHNREGLTLQRIWAAICDYDLWPLYILGLASAIPGGPPATYLTLLLRNVGFNTFDTHLLTIPSQAMGIVNMFLLALMSGLVSERTFVSMLEDLWILPFLVALYALPANPNPWLFFGLVTGLLSSPYQPAGTNISSSQFGCCSRNSGSVASRTVDVSLYSMFVEASTVISAQIDVTSTDAPRYKRGNRILIIICCINVFLLYPCMKVYYIWRNRPRAKIWDAMTREAMHYLNTTKDVGNKRLDFRFIH